MDTSEAIMMTTMESKVQSVLTCNVIDGVESDAKLPYFEGVIFLPTLLEVLYPHPVLTCERGIIVSQECWSLELF